MYDTLLLILYKNDIILCTHIKYEIFYFKTIVFQTSFCALTYSSYLPNNQNVGVFVWFKNRSKPWPKTKNATLQS